MTQSTLADMRLKLKTNLEAINGVAAVYDLTPEVAPTTDLPAVILEKNHPFLTWMEETNGALRFVWHFKILFLYKTLGTQTSDVWDDGIVPYVNAFAQAIWGDITLNAKANNLAPAQAVDVGILDYKSNSYFGFEVDVDIHQIVRITFG